MYQQVQKLVERLENRKNPEAIPENLNLKWLDLILHGVCLAVVRHSALFQVPIAILKNQKVQNILNWSFQTKISRLYLEYKENLSKLCSVFWVITMLKE